LEFEKLAHGLLLYNNSYDDTYFVTRFVAGLKDEIRKVIVLHRPKNVDTASALALLQEEELHKSRSKGFSKDSARTSFRSLPNKPRSSDGETSRQKVEKSETDDKLATLKEFRRRNGLCFKCGEKWSHNHKCSAQVSLHVIEELLDALEDTESEAEAADSSD